jgi:hypothetical protein
MAITAAYGGGMGDIVGHFVCSPVWSDGQNISVSISVRVNLSGYAPQR